MVPSKALHFNTHFPLLWVGVLCVFFFLPGLIWRLINVCEVLSLLALGECTPVQGV